MSGIEGDWQLVIDTPMGKREPKVTFKVDGTELSGIFAGQMGSSDFSGGTVDGNDLEWTVDIQAMGQSISMKCKVTVDGDKLAGDIAGPQGTIPVSGERI